jgi:hypothetical protein
LVAALEHHAAVVVQVDTSIQLRDFYLQAH